MATKTTKPTAEEDAKNAALDAEIFAMFAEAEAELVEEGVPRPDPNAPDTDDEQPTGPNPDALTDDQKREWMKLNDAHATAIPTGTPSKVSPSLQRFNLQVPEKKKKK